MITVDTIKDLLELEIANREDNSSVLVQGYTEAYDDGGGIFAWEKDSLQTPNGGTILKSPKTGTGRWVRKLSVDYVTPEMFGAVGDGVKDDSEAWQAAVDSGASLIKSDLIKEYKIDQTVNLRSDLKIDSCKFYQEETATDRIIFEAEGTTVSEVMPADIDENSFTITVNDGSVYSENQLIRLRSDELWSENQSVAFGELVVVKSIDGNTLTLKSSTLLPYTSGGNSRIRAVSPVENVTFENCIARTDKNDGNSIFIQGNYCRNIKILDCKSTGFDYGHYYFTRTYDLHATRCELNDSGVFGGTNYGFVIGKSCYNANILDSYGDGFRHFVTVGGNAGPSRFVTVDNCTITNSIDAGLDTHAAADDFRFTNNNIYISDTAEAGVRDGIITQAASGVIKGNTIYEARSHGISCFNCITPNLAKPLVLDISDNKIIFAQSLEQNVAGLENAAIDIWTLRAGLTMATLDSLNLNNNTVQVTNTTTILPYFIRIKSEDFGVDRVNIHDNKLIGGYSEKGIDVETVNHKIENLSIANNQVAKPFYANQIAVDQDINTYSGGSIADFTVTDFASGGYLDTSYQRLTKDASALLFETYTATGSSVTMRVLVNNISGTWTGNLYNETTATTIGAFGLNGSFNNSGANIGNNLVRDTGDNGWHEVIISSEDVSPGDIIRYYVGSGSGMGVGDSVDISEVRVFEDYKEDLVTTVYDCISLKGTVALPIKNVTINGNILEGSNYGISMNHADNISLSGNIYSNQVTEERLVLNTTNLLNYDV